VLSKDTSNKIIVSSLRKSARNLTKISSKIDNHKSNSTRNKSNSKLNHDSLSTSCDETEERVQENNHIVGKLLSDKEVIEEQQRIERLLLQEREDLEFARRLQAQFDEMEWISGRTRRSRKATENVKSEVDSREIDSAMRIVYSTSKAHETSKRKPIANQIVNTNTAKRKLGRPPKCVKVMLQTCKNESGAR
jgi:crotonobetainyl-CoA:carnitine CoA-transferase CaiB-like acyl-CoA transferase